MKRQRLRAFGGPMVVVGVLLSAPAQATTACSATMTDVQFGTVDPFDGYVDVTATINWSCTYSGLLGILYASFVRMCFSIEDGVSGGGSCTPRRLVSGSNDMSFQLYRDSSRTSTWGSLSGCAGSEVQELVMFQLLSGGTTKTGSATVYGRVPSGQTTLVPGAYANSFTGSHTNLSYRYTEALLSLGTYPASCTSGGTGGGTGTFPFSASATVVAACEPSFAVQDIDFGTQGLLTANIDTTAAISPQCTNTTPYQIGLGDGLHAIGTTRRMQSSGGQYVIYELYRDAARSQRWGNTQNVDTVMGAGSGEVQEVTIYSRVSPQSTPPAGDYSDTVTVTIYY